jgi:hypothetical protein
MQIFTIRYLGNDSSIPLLDIWSQYFKEIKSKVMWSADVASTLCFCTATMLVLLMTGLCLWKCKSFVGLRRNVEHCSLFRYHFCFVFGRSKVWISVVVTEVRGVLITRCSTTASLLVLLSSLFTVSVQLLCNLCNLKGCVNQSVTTGKHRIQC